MPDPLEYQLLDRPPIPAEVKVVGWGMIVVGAYSLLDLAAAVWAGHPGLSFGVVVLPVGVGLLRRSNLCREMGIGFGWFVIFAAAVFGFVFLVLAATTTRDMTLTFTFLSARADGPPAVVFGAAVLLGLSGLAYIVIRVLRSPAAVAAFRPVG